MSMPALAEYKEMRRHDHVNIKDCPLYRLLSPELRDEAESKPYLWDYLHAFPVEELGVPSFYEHLPASLRKERNPNVIYPLDEDVFAHVYGDPQDSRNYYVVIDPGIGEDFSELLHMLEEHLVEIVEALNGVESSEDRIALLHKVIDELFSANGPRRKGFWPFAQRKPQISVTSEQIQGLKYLVVRDKEGMGIIEPLLRDPNIEDISCSGVGVLYVEHKIFGSLKTSIGFADEEDLESYVIGLSEKIGRPVTFREPIIDATLKDGSRINIVFGSDISKRGSNFTIRRFASTPMSLLDLIDTGSLNYEIAAYLSLVIGEGMNVFIAGETASGKTTLLNAVTALIKPSAKIVSIEDTPELQVPHPNWTREVVRGGSNAERSATVTMFDLLKAALRQRPDEIMIGEIRGEEGAIAFQAMQTGHACMATFHAASVEKLIQRLTGNPINVPKTYIDNLNVVVIQSAVRLPDGRPARRIMSVNEIVGYDSGSGTFSFIEVFRWNPAEDRFEFPGFMNTYLLEYKIAPKRGIPPAQKRRIYGELTRRANIFQRLHEKGVRDFHEFYRILAKANKEGLLR